MTSDLEISVEHDGHRASLHVTGTLDAYTGQRLRAVIAEQLDRGVNRVDLDASGITFVDSVGLRVLTDTGSDLEDRGGRLVILGPSVTMAQILRFTQLTERFGL